jgi:hypothetical protein
MQQRYILTYDLTDLTLEYAPEGWNDLKYTITRNMSYYGLFRSFSGSLKFVEDGKEFIDNIIDTYGFEAEIQIRIQELNQDTRIWETKVNGILNFDPKVYLKKQLYTEVNFEDSVIHKKFKNREDSDIAYNRKESVNGTILPGFASETKTVQLRGQNTDVANATAIYPFEAFNRVLQVICDLDYNPVLSSIFGRPEYDYVDDGKAANVMLSKGLLMRGFTIAGDDIIAGETNLNFKFNDLFKNFNGLFNIGLDIVYDSTNDRYNFVIEDKNYFFQTTELFTLDSLSNLTYEFDDDLMIQTIKTGYKKFTQDNDYGLAEYNNRSEFMTPISVSSKILDLESNYRADGVAFQIAIDNRFTGADEENKTDIDEDIFFIHSFDDSGTLRTVKDENFDVVAGLYGNNPIQANIYISPARNMTRWGDYIRSSLTFFEDTGDIRFNKAEALSNLSSQYGAETDTIFENRDIAINDLSTPRFSGRKITFEAPLTRDQINTITDNPYGLVKLWDYIAKEYNYGWIKEASTDRVDRDTTWELWEVANLVEISNNMVYMDTTGIDFMDGNSMISVKA